MSPRPWPLLPLALLAPLALPACDPTGVLPDDDDATAPTDEPSEAEQTARRLYDPDHVVEIAITIAPDDAAALAAETNDLFSLLEGEDCLDAPWSGPFTWYPADITVDGTLVTNVGLRKKGLIGSLSSTKPSLKVKFDKFVPEQTLGGLERLTLNNSVSDPSLMNQCLGYQLFADAGLASPRCNFAHVTANGVDLGVYVHVEPLKKDFLRRAYDGVDDGDLYEGTLSDFRPGWVTTFEVETSDTDPTLGPLRALTDALALPDDDEALDAIAELVDLPRFRTFWAMEVLVGHQDGYTNNRNNFYVYRPPGESLELLPWGIDAIFRDGGGPDGQSATVVFATSALPRRLWAMPGQRALYLDELERLLDTVWDADALLDSIDAMRAQVLPFAVPPPPAEAVDGLRQFVADREPRLRAALDEPLPVFDTALPGSPCLVHVGDLRVEFAATFGTLGAQAPLDEGSCRLTGVYDGTSFDLSGGAIGGVYEGRVVVGALARTGPTTVAEALAVVPGWALQQDPVPLGGFGSQAYLLSIDLTTTPGTQTVLGSLWNAELSFTALAGEQGAPMEGWFEGPVYRNPD
jgi:spore coat protein H